MTPQKKVDQMITINGKDLSDFEMSRSHRIGKVSSDIIQD